MLRRAVVLHCVHLLQLISRSEQFQKSHYFPPFTMASAVGTIISARSEPLAQQQSDSPGEPRSGKRKERDPTHDVSDQPHDVTQRSPSHGTRGGKRIRRFSGSSNHAQANGTDSTPFQASGEKERWKKHMSYRRSRSFTSRDPLGLEANVRPFPPSVRLNGHSGHRRARIGLSPQKYSKDRVIHPPKIIMCPDPLQLEAKIKAYEASHQDGMSKTERQAERFRYGNYNRYYGYREVATDPRYALLRRDWVEGRDCLDIGCNTGQVTLALTRDFRPRLMVGIDIDKSLIQIAKRNVRHYLTEDICRREGFPKSLPILYGPIAAPAILEDGVERPREFPCNVAFLECDYVPKENSVSELETEEFDTIFALSITKWIHLNVGDDGLKRFFRRTFRHLRPGGLLILEPQEWNSYNNGRNKGKLTRDMKKIFQEILMKPEDFQPYLLSPEVGFESCEKIELPSNSSVVAGFKRCLFLFKKPSPA